MIQSYTFGIVDGEYILRRNFNQLKTELTNKELYNETIDVSYLYVSFINSIMKFKRDHNVKFCVLCFDKSKYYSACAIENYKGDRYNATEEKLSLEEQLQNTELTEEERKDLEHQLVVANFENNNFWKYQEVKKSLLEDSKWSRSGFHTIYKRGYESDMIGYYIASRISEVHKSNPAITGLLYSADRDWVNFQQDGIEFISAWNNINKYENLEETYERFKNLYNEKYPDAEVKLDMYSYGILNELAGDTHNNASVILEDDEVFPTLSWEEYYYRILNQDAVEGFKSYDMLRKCYEALHLLHGKTCDNGYCPVNEQGITYIDDLKGLVSSVLSNCDKYETGILASILEEYDIDINMMNYSKYISQMNAVTNF